LPFFHHLIIRLPSELLISESFALPRALALELYCLPFFLQLFTRIRPFVL
jgi:hypothetical protein